MPIFSAPQAQSWRDILPNLGLLPSPNAAPPGARAMARRGTRGAAGDSTEGGRSGYTPEDVLRSQRDIANYFENIPAAPLGGGRGSDMVAHASNFGRGYMSTRIPTRNEDRMRENQRLQTEAINAVMAAPDQASAFRALSESGIPHLQSAVLPQRLQQLSPAHQMEQEKLKLQLEQARRDAEFDQYLHGQMRPGAAAPGGGGGQQIPPVGEVPMPPMGDQPGVPGVTVAPGDPQAAPPPQAPSPTHTPPPAAPPAVHQGVQGMMDAMPVNPNPPPPGMMRLGGPMPPPAAPPGETPQPAQSLMDQQRERLTSGQQPAAMQPPGPAATPPVAGGGSVASILASRSEAERLAFMGLMRQRDPASRAKALEMLQLWADPSGGSSRIAAEAQAKALGNARGEAAANLPTALENGTSMLRNIDAVLKDPNLGSVTGWMSSWPMTWLPNMSPENTSTRERISQVQGQAFLQAYQALRGGGAISDREGQAASAAFARLNNLGQDDAGYKEALYDARRHMVRAIQLAYSRAGQRPPPDTAFPPPPEESGTPGARRGPPTLGRRPPTADDPLGIR